MAISEIKGINVDTIKIWTQLENVESQSLTQLRNVSTLPNVYGIAAMADVHAGKGATVGSVIAMKDAIIPAAVGVDIGCGMMAMRLPGVKVDNLPDLSSLRGAIEDAIPTGFNSYDSITKEAKNAWGKLDSRFNKLIDHSNEAYTKARTQLGTLGGGNHFIEICKDTDDNVWLMLHSGSRNIGKRIADEHIKIAKGLEHNNGLVDSNLAYFIDGTPEMDAYRHDLMWAQEYAKHNRSVMAKRIWDVLKGFIRGLDLPGDAVHCHHNYVAREQHFGQELYITRKGAISAKSGEWGIIPGSMGTRSYIVRGLGNEESFHSASHGAGRRMSRSQAKKTFNIDDVIEQTEGVECRKDKGIIDELPGAYKNIDQVMENQKDLVSIEYELKALISVKG